MSRSTRRLAGVVVAGVAAAALAAAPAIATSSGASAGKKPAPGKTQFDVQILSFNDFHGNLEPPSGSSGRIIVGPLSSNTVDAGGVEYLATQLAQARKGHPYSLTVAAGDIVGASPLLSAAFHDEPTIEAMNALGLDVTSVGNHEFDEGYRELQRLAAGGCIDDGAGQNNQDSCPDGSFDGADFDILAANVFEKATGKTILPAYTVKKFNGAKIGFIGMTLEATPNIVTASGVAGLEFKDEVETANALVPVLKAQGVNAIIVLLHEGATPKGGVSFDYSCGKGGTIEGPVVDINTGLDPAIDMIISGHTHQPYVCALPDGAGNPRLITSASSFGRLYTDTTVTYDRRTSDIVRPTMADSANRIVARTVAKDPAQTALITKYKTLITPVASRVLGHINEDILRSTGANAAGEWPLGDLIADAQLADPSTVTGGQPPVIAFMNPGGIRTELTFASSKYGEAPGDVTYEEAFNVQPFNNYLVSLSLTGEQIYKVLNQQITGANLDNGTTFNKILQVSDGFAYAYTKTGTPHVIEGSVTLGGEPLDLNKSYRIVTNNFLADGGDGFPAFREGTGLFFGGLDIDAFASYLGTFGPGGYTPGALDRISIQ